MTANSLTARWSLGGYAKQYDWPQCKYCGRAQDHDCQPVDCMACGSRQCIRNGHCRVCYFGYLPGWARTVEQSTCGYKGCDAQAVSDAPWIRRVCKADLGRAKYRRGKVLADNIAERIAERDSGIGRYPTPGWRWVQ